MRKTKRNYYDRKTIVVSFKAFKELSGKTSSVGSKIDVDDFNNFFVQVDQNLVTDIPCNSTSADIEAKEKSYFFCPTDESEVSIAIEKLKKKTYDGHDGINIRMVKLCLPIKLLFLISVLINTLMPAFFQTFVKSQKYYHKTGKQTEPNSFRPIS